MFKHIRGAFFAVVLMAAAMVTSCRGGEEELSFLRVSETELYVTGDGGTCRLSVSCSGDFIVKSSVAWVRCEVIPTRVTDNLVLYVEENPAVNVRVGQIRISAKNCKDVTVTVSQQSCDPMGSPDCRLLSLKLDRSLNALESDVEFKLDNLGRNFTAKYLKWIERSDPEMFILTFETTGKSVKVGGKLAVSGETKVSLAEKLSVVVTAENGAANEYFIDFNCPQINTELPVLRLQPDSEINSTEVYVPTIATLYSPHTPDGWWTPENGKIEVRGRGNSTWGLPKKPYRIKFPEKFSPVGLNHASAKSWVLLANDMDKSLIRDALGWVMSSILFDPGENYHDPLAVMFTPCTQFVNVYMGNRYHGLYHLTDQLERAKDRVAVDKLEAADGADPAKIEGGYIVESSVHWEAAPVRFNSRVCGIQFDRKYPKDDDFDPAQYAYIENHIAKAEEALYGAGFKDPQNGWRRYFDEKTLADYIIVKELCGDMDGYISTYIYKRRGSDKLFFGPIWDVDKGWGNEKRTAGYTADKDHSLMIRAGFQMPGCNRADWYNRFWEDETFRAFVNRRWKSKRTELVEAVKKAARSLPASMGKAVDANFSVWPFNYQACWDAPLPAETYQLEIDRIIRLTDRRAAVLDTEFAK